MLRTTLKPIVTALRKIQERGSFCADTSMPHEALKVKIEEFGNLRFPLTARSVKKLITLANPAHFGWQDQTLLDTRIRNTWEIPRELISLTWKIPLEPFLDQLKNDLGLPKNSILEVSLHNLLIYEPGQFFKPHQDSEKLDGMIASLVIVLPCSHIGGCLVVDHHGEKIKITGKSTNDLTLAAFYADCPHEVETVKRGYRVSLTFNLVLKQGPQNDNTPTPEPQEELTKTLHAYFSKDNCAKSPRDGLYDPVKLIYLLDHEYTAKGLAWDLLKNGDQVRAYALKEAAQSLGLHIHLALAEVNEVWEADLLENHSRLLKNGKPSRKRDGIYILCGKTKLKNWVDGVDIPFLNKKNEYDADDQTICWTKATNDFKPFHSEYEKWMGNYGNTIDRWYYRAAVVLWQKSS